MAEQQQQQLQIDFLSQLPNDILLRILSFLASDEIAGMNLVSKRFGSLCSLSSLPILRYKSAIMSFHVSMEPFPDSMSENGELIMSLFVDGKENQELSFANAMESFPDSLSTMKPFFVDAIDNHSRMSATEPGFYRRLPLVKAMESFPDTMSTMKPPFLDAIDNFPDFMFQTPKPLFLDLSFHYPPELKSSFLDSFPIFHSPTSSSTSETLQYLIFRHPKPVLPLGHHDLISIRELRLRMTPDRTVESTRQQAELVQAHSMIELAIKRKVKVLDLRFVYDQLLPCKIFTASSIRVLKLDRCKFKIRGDMIHLPGLRKLHLDSSGDEESIQRLVSGCPSMESLTIAGIHYLSSLRIGGLSKLSRFELLLCYGLRCLEIDAPSLRCLVYFSQKPTSQVVLSNCLTLRELELHGDGVEHHLFRSLLSSLPNLEQLKIKHTHWHCIEISHRRLKILELDVLQSGYHRKDSCHVAIDTPNLQSFSYRGLKMPLISAMAFLNPSSLHKVAVGVDEYEHYSHSFLSKLREFFGRLNRCTVVELTIQSKKEIFFPRKKMFVSSSPLFDIKHLSLMVYCMRFQFSDDRDEADGIMDRVLGMCHPQTLSIKSGSHLQFLKALYKKFRTRDNDRPKYCVSRGIKSWKHCLEDFQIIDDKSRLEIERVFAMPKDMIFEMPLTQREVRFRLKWQPQLPTIGS